MILKSGQIEELEREIEEELDHLPEEIKNRIKIVNLNELDIPEERDIIIPTPDGKF